MSNPTNRLIGRRTDPLPAPFLRAQETVVRAILPQIEEKLGELLRENFMDPEGPGMPFGAKLELIQDAETERWHIGVMLGIKRLAKVEETEEVK